MFETFSHSDSRSTTGNRVSFDQHSGGRVRAATYLAKTHPMEG